MSTAPVITPVGDRALLISLGQGIDPSVNAAVHRAAERIQQEWLPGVVAVVPAYCSLMVHYDCALTGFEALERSLADLMAADPGADGPASSPAGQVVEIPVCYGGRFGPDIGHVAARNGLTTEEVVDLHTAVSYRVYMLGFTPGFPYLGGLSRRLETPRLDTPRQRIAAGSVGIAGRQTGVYPIESPGGWQLIGRTPMRLFTPGNADPVPYRPGDHIQFRAVSASQFQSLLSGGNGQ
jgi:inhibitor of KinA